MISIIGQAMVLATHANAFLAGHRQFSDFLENPWFQHWRSIQFTLGDDRSQVLADSVNHWFQLMETQGMSEAYLWSEPSRGSIDVVNRVFSGAQNWSPVSVYKSGSVIWKPSAAFDRAETSDRKWDGYWGGFQNNSGTYPLPATPAEATQKLDEALLKIIGFSTKYRADGDWTAIFESARGVLADFRIDDQLESTKNAFPPGLYPIESHQLFEASFRGWVFGGMGWWSDWSDPDLEVQHEFREITWTYFDSICRSLYVAGKVKL